MQFRTCPFATARPTGRPRAVELTPAQGQRLTQIYLATNRTRKEGSMEAAWVLFCEECGLFPHTHAHHRLVGALPTAAVAWMRRGKGLVPTHRGGARELRLKGPYQQGGMRTHWSEDRRLLAGESYSVDDLTRNVACWIPWPHGGCKCSEKYGVRLGRWQTLVVCDDATWAIPAVSSVFRYASSYQGVDAASIIFQTELNVGMAGFDDDDSRWIVEGGVWQSAHSLAALAGRFHSAKGRPGQKLIERWFGASQTLDAVWNLDMGRQRGENLEANKLWMACRAGEEDPRPNFLSFNDGQGTLIHTITYMNEREVRSPIYGKWVPQERWETDTAERPLTRRDPTAAWVLSPERRELKVSRAGMLQCAVLMADGVSRRAVWNAPFLYEHTGLTVDLYFDANAELPLQGTVVKHGTRQVLGIAVCQNPYGHSRDADRERVASIRRTMLSDLNIILGGNAGGRLVTGRSPNGVIEINRLAPSDTSDTSARSDNQFSRRSDLDHVTDSNSKRPHEPDACDLQPFNRSGGKHSEISDLKFEISNPRAPFDTAAAREGSVLVSRTTRGGVDPSPAPAAPLRGLSRAAEKARELQPNW